MRWDMAAVAAGVGWVASAIIAGAEAKGLLQTRGDAVRHLALAVAAASTVVYKIEKHRRLDDVIFQLGRQAEAIERDRNVYQIRAAAL